MEINNPSSVPDEKSGGENVNVPDALAQINKATGREYKTLDEAFGGIKETYSYVGEKKTTDKVVDKVDVSKMPKSQLKDRVNELEWEVKKNNFLAQNPEAKDYVDEILAISKAKSLEPQEAYDNSRFKSLIKSQADAGDTTPILDTGNRITGNQNDDTGITVEKLGSLPLEEQAKIIQKLPSYNKELPRQHLSSRRRSSY